MVTISGHLIDGLGDPIADCQIELIAKKNSASVFVKTTAHHSPNGAGYYTMNVKPGIYAVRLLVDGCPPNDIGDIKIFSDSKPGTLNDFLLNPSESEISPEILAQIVEERKLAQKSASDAKNSANEAVETLENSVKKTGEASQTVDGTLDVKELKENGNRVYSKGNKPNPSDINAVSLTGEESQTVEGVLNATTLQENGQRVYSPNNKPTVSDVGALSTDGGTVTGDLTISKSNPQIMIKNQSGVYSYRIVATNSLAAHYINSQNRLRYTYASNTWNFENSSVTINGISVLKAGDGGLLSKFATSDGVEANNITGSGFNVTNKTLSSNSPYDHTGLMTLATQSGGFAQIGMSFTENKIAIRSKAGGITRNWTEIITTANSTVDSNGFLKSASPIIRLFSNDDVDTVDGFEKSGCGLINSEAKGVTANKIAIGHYEIHGSLGFAKEGWYITLPEDANGNKKFFAEYSTDENNVITVKTFTKKFDMATCEVVAGEPVDITADRWIDIRLEMPIKAATEDAEHIEN